MMRAKVVKEKKKFWVPKRQPLFVVFDLHPNSDISCLVNMDAFGLYYCRLSIATLATLAS